MGAGVVRGAGGRSVMEMFLSSWARARMRLSNRLVRATNCKKVSSSGASWRVRASFSSTFQGVFLGAFVVFHDGHCEPLEVSVVAAELLVGLAETFEL